MPIDKNILDAIGNTPMVPLTRISQGLPAMIYAKLELMNPGGSIKDRIALAMIDEAEKSGALTPGGTIVEATAGNTGVALAMVAAIRGYRCVFVMPDKMSPEKMNLLRAYGAEIVVTRSDVTKESPEYYINVSERMAREIPGAFRTAQFSNPHNPAAHYHWTAPEIWNDMGGNIAAFVCGVGTGGTISGVGKYLREKNPKVEIIAADPVGSVISGGDGKTPWKVEGIGEDFFPETYDPHIITSSEAISDRDSFLAARRLAREEGILAGGSTGTSIAACVRVAKRLPQGANVVTLITDTGRNYLSKLYNDDWMRENIG